MTFPFRYELTEEALEVRLAGWTLRRLPYEDVAGARVGWAWWTESWMNLWPPGRMLVVRRRTGLLRNLVINPPDAEAFAAELLRKAASRVPPLRPE